MKIRTSLNSPFGRKVRFAALHLGLPDVEVLDTSFLDANDPLRVENPLGKMPVLTTPSGAFIFDSAVILGYLDVVSGGRLLPVDPLERVAMQTFEALCDGILDAGVSIVMERRMRPAELQYQGWIDHQQGKVDRALAAIAAAPGPADQINAGSIALACALTWLEMRQIADWRTGAPGLSTWLAQFETAAPRFSETAYPG